MTAVGSISNLESKETHFQVYQDSIKEIKKRLVDLESSDTPDKTQKIALDVYQKIAKANQSITKEARIELQKLNLYFDPLTPLTDSAKEKLRKIYSFDPTIDEFNLTESLPCLIIPQYSIEREIAFAPSDKKEVLIQQKDTFINQCRATAEIYYQIGAEVNHKYNGTPFLMKCIRNFYRELESMKASPNASLNPNDLLKIVEWLIEHGANIDAQDENNGETALFLAVRANDEPLVQCLKQHNVDMNIQNYEGKTVSSLITDTTSLLIKQCLANQ